ncbi:MAG: branched-chain amino acid ABC transporter permease [Chloroflexi bacterium]|nr:branched-chain amino acid ABC transporter permease [Chloroflexota bacterium]
MGITAFTSKKLWGGGVLLLLVVALALLPFYTSGYTPVLMTTILMYIILTVSWVIFSGPTNYISLAPAAFFGVGIYTMALLGDQLPLLVVVCLGGLVSFILALLVGALTLRLRGIYFTIFTFGLVMLIMYILLYWEFNITKTRGRFVVLESNSTVYYVMFGILLVTLLTAYFIRRSKFGLALQSIGQNEEAAAHSGVNVTMVKVITFAVSAIFMGAAGAIMATRWTYIDPSIAFKPFYSFLPVLMAIFGGMGQLYGPVIGAAIFAYLQEVLVTRFSELYMLIFGVVLIASILFMPKGLVGVGDWLIKWLGRKLRRGGSAVQNADT